MIAIHKTLRIINTLYPNEPAYIFTDNLNVLYLLNTQIKHPTLHNSHPDQITLAIMVQLLQSRTQPITLYKVRSHARGGHTPLCFVTTCDNGVFMHFSIFFPALFVDIKLL